MSLALLVGGVLLGLTMSTVAVLVWVVRMGWRLQQAHGATSSATAEGLATLRRETVEGLVSHSKRVGELEAWRQRVLNRNGGRE